MARRVRHAHRQSPAKVSVRAAHPTSGSEGSNENGPRRARLVSIRGSSPDQSWFIREWVRVSFMNTYTSSEQAMQAVTYQ
ncbi:hypothetical protein D9M68_235490 [compost metagenome]